MKIEVSKAQSSWFVFKEDNSDMSRIKWVRQRLRTVMLWEFFLLLIIIQSNIKNRERI